jgi:hypothetical protein
MATVESRLRLLRRDKVHPLRRGASCRWLRSIKARISPRSPLAHPLVAVWPEHVPVLSRRDLALANRRNVPLRRPTGRRRDRYSAT